MGRVTQQEEERRWTVAVKRLEEGWTTLPEMRSALQIPLSDASLRRLVRQIRLAYPARFERGTLPGASPQGNGWRARYRLKARVNRSAAQFAEEALRLLPTLQECYPGEEEALRQVRGALALIARGE